MYGIVDDDDCVGYLGCGTNEECVDLLEGKVDCQCVDGYTGSNCDQCKSMHRLYSIRAPKWSPVGSSSPAWCIRKCCLVTWNVYLMPKCNYIIFSVGKQNRETLIVVTACEGQCNGESCASDGGTGYTCTCLSDGVSGDDCESSALAYLFLTVS